MPDTESFETRQPTIRVAARPADTNSGGDIFGGWIMSQVDIAGSIAAYRLAQGRVVTVAVDSLQFHQPVLVGDLISCYADIIRVGRTSITVQVEVYAERDSGGIQTDLCGDRREPTATSCTCSKKVNGNLQAAWPSQCLKSVRSCASHCMWNISSCTTARPSRS